MSSNGYDEVVPSDSSCSTRGRDPADSNPIHKDTRIEELRRIKPGDDTSRTNKNGSVAIDYSTVRFSGVLRKFEAMGVMHDDECTKATQASPPKRVVHSKPATRTISTNTEETYDDFEGSQTREESDDMQATQIDIPKHTVQTDSQAAMRTAFLNTEFEGSHPLEEFDEIQVSQVGIPKRLVPYESEATMSTSSVNTETDDFGGSNSLEEWNDTQVTEMSDPNHVVQSRPTMRSTSMNTESNEFEGSHSVKEPNEIQVKNLGDTKRVFQYESNPTMRTTSVNTETNEFGRSHSLERSNLTQVTPVCNPKHVVQSDSQPLMTTTSVNTESDEFEGSQSMKDTNRLPVSQVSIPKRMVQSESNPRMRTTSVNTQSGSHLVDRSNEMQVSQIGIPGSEVQSGSEPAMRVTHKIAETEEFGGSHTVEESNEMHVNPVGTSKRVIQTESKPLMKTTLGNIDPDGFEGSNPMQELNERQVRQVGILGRVDQAQSGSKQTTRTTPVNTEFGGSHVTDGSIGTQVSLVNIPGRVVQSGSNPTTKTTPVNTESDEFEGSHSMAQSTYMDVLPDSVLPSHNQLTDQQDSGVPHTSSHDTNWMTSECPKRYAAVKKIELSSVHQDPLSGYEWYFGDIDRQNCERMLKKMILENGAYLVRKSRHGGSDSPYSVGVVYKQHIYHVLIRIRPNQKFAVGRKKPDEKVFNTIPDLISFYQNNCLELIGDGDMTSVFGAVTLQRCPSKLK